MQSGKAVRKEIEFVSSPRSRIDNRRLAPHSGIRGPGILDDVRVIQHESK